MTTALAAGIPATTLRIAAVQTHAASGDIAGNANRAATLADRAARGGAHVVVFPELHLCAYDLPALTRARDDAGLRADHHGIVTDDRLAALAAAAAAHAITVLVGAAIHRADGALTNSVIAVAPDGAARAVYDKHHLWHDERDLFTPGTRHTLLPVGEWRLALAVCYDLSFPEHARTAALAGAHAYLCLGAFATGTEHRAGIYLAARALENTIFTVFTNPIGGPAHRTCAGGTTAHRPDGTRSAEPTPDRETILTTDLEPNELRRVRGFLPMLQETAERR